METNIEEALSLMPFVPISTEAFKRFLELEEAEQARNVESRLGTVKKTYIAEQVNGLFREYEKMKKKYGGLADGLEQFLKDNL